ncbi:Uma2 family endonuclease [Desulfosporosinus burensis]
MPLPDEAKRYTYADYLEFPDDERWEIIDGVPYMQSAPTWQHQNILLELAAQLRNYLSGKECRAFISPFDLRLPKIDEDDEHATIVIQPDILVICDKSKLIGSGYCGTPELIIEILSPSTERIDRLTKFWAYEKAGVKEYWIVAPDTKIVSVFILQDNNRYGRPELYTDADSVEVSIFPDLVLELRTVFNF